MRPGQRVSLACMSRRRFGLASLALVALLGALVLAGPASATFRGRNGRIAWGLWNAGGGGGGGFASLTTYPAHASQGKRIGYCPEDNQGNVCNDWQNVTFSPDGTHLLWDQTGPSGTEVITLANSDATNPQTVVSDSFDDSQASFSPDGQKIVYVRQTKGAGGLFGTLVIGDLSAASSQIVNASIQGAEPLFSPGGKTILFVRPDKQGNPGGLWSIRRDGTGLRRLVARASVFDISPSGRSIAYITAGGGVFIARADGSHARRIARKPTGDLDVSAVRFSPNGKLVAFTAMASIGPALYVINVAGGKPRLIFDSGDPRNNTTGLSWQPLHS
jgi:Tol biopolymer transport system component